MSKTTINNKIEIIPNSKTVILCTNNVDKLKLSKIFADEDTLFITTRTKELNEYECCEKLVKQLKISNLFNYDFNTLSIGEKQMVQICYALSSNKEKIVLVDAISNVSSINKDKILKYLKKIDKTIIYITNNKEDIMYFNEFVLYDNEIILSDKLDNILKMENKFKSVGFSLPFMSDLSLKLKYYNLVNKSITSMDRMVNKLWK